MAKSKKKMFQFSKNEFIFNIVSLVVVIGIALYFGGRSFYYYGLQSVNTKGGVQTLDGIIVNNNSLVKDGDGLHRDSDGYFFKGNVTNNYVMIFNRLYRVLRVDNDGSVKLVSENTVASFMWGDDSKYKNSNVHNWLTKTNEEHSGIYLNTIPSSSKFLKKTVYSEDVLKDNKIKTGKSTYKDYVTTLSINDYINSGSSKGFLNNGKIFYLIGLDGDDENLFVDLDGTVQSCDSLDGYGVRAVITLKENSKIVSGDGSVGNPYVINQDGKSNRIDSYVKLGNDVWRVYNEDNGILKMYKNTYINNSYSDITLPYSKSGSLFDLKDKKSLAYFLNNTYLSTLTYSNYLVDNYYYVGEISNDTGYEYKNIYNNFVICKVGLLNIFDYNSNNELNDYFHMNTTSSVGSIQYSTLANGLLEEADVTELKHIVPVISINSSYIKGGSGSLNDPYVVE